MTNRYYTVAETIRAVQSGSSRQSVVGDALGSVTGAAQNGHLTSSARRSPFGRTIVSPTDQPGRIGWIGQSGYLQSDGHTISHYVRARHFSARVGRWLSIDPLWPRSNAYTYASDSPVRRIDPTGLQDGAGDIVPPVVIDHGCSDDQVRFFKEAFAAICKQWAKGVPRIDTGKLLDCVRRKMPKECGPSYLQPNVSKLADCLHGFCSDDIWGQITCNDIRGRCDPEACAIAICVPEFRGIPGKILLCPSSVCKIKGRPNIHPGCTFLNDVYQIKCPEGRHLPPASTILLHEMMHHCVMCNTKADPCAESLTQALACCVANLIR